VRVEVAFPKERALAAAVAFVLAVLAAAVVPSVRPSGLFRDFEAFYCAGESVRLGADPYLAEPIGSCERRPKPEPVIAGTPGLAMPAPVPPFALLPFRVLSPLPFVPAVLVWLAIIVACVAVSVWAVSRFTGLPWPAIALAFALSDGYASLCLGQIAPVAVAAIAVAAWLLAEKRDVAAACAAACAMIEPHVGAPACAALFVYRSRARLPLAAIAAAFVLASIAATNLATTIEYVRAVLPAHAVSEIANEKQLSLTYALHRLGVNDALALHTGECWYAAMIVIGAIVSGRIARRTNAAAIVAIPPALAVLGGPFVHIVQIAAALPAAFLLYAYGPPHLRRATGIAIAALAIPWIQFANVGTIFIPVSAFVVAVLVLTLVDERPLFALAAGAATIALFTWAIALVKPIIDPGPILVAHYDPRALAEVSWTLFVRTIGTGNASAFDLVKLPTIAALCLIAYATLVETKAASTAPAHVALGGKEAAASRRTSDA
jgi:hypothetical protein